MSAKEFFESITAHGPIFISTLTDILSGPKTFIRKLNFDEKSTLGKVLAFNLSCLAVAFIFQLSFVATTKELYQVFATLFIFFVLTSFLVAFAYKTGFFAVGGKASLKNHIIINLYIAGPAYLVSVIISTTSKSILLIEEPDLLPIFKEFVANHDQTNPDIYLALYESNPGLLAVALNILGNIAILVWLLYSWGCYRYINNVSKAKSTIAFVIAMCISIPISYLLSILRRMLELQIFS